MPDYTLNFPIKAADPGPINKIADAMRSTGTATKQSAAELKAWEESVAKGVAAGKTLAQSIAQADAQLKAVAPSASAAAGVLNVTAVSLDRVSAASRRTITDVQATGAALRTLEGSMSIRAVEQFTTKILGLGTAFQAIFPIIGALALAEVIGRGVSEVIKLKDAWDPVIQAQKESNRLLKEATKEIGTQAGRLRELELAHIGRTQGAAAELSARASDIGATARYSDADRIALLQRELTGLQKIAQTRYNPAGPFPQLALSPEEVSIVRGTGFRFGLADPGRLGLGAGNITPELRQAANIRITDVQAELRGAQLKQAADLAESQGYKEEASQSILKTGETEAQKHLRVEREARERALQNDVREWERIQKEKETALKARPGLADRFADELPLSRFGIGAYGQSRSLATELREAEEAGAPGRGARNEFSFLRSPMSSIPTGYISPEGQLRLAQDQERRTMGQIGVRARLAGVGEPGQIEDTYQSRLDFAKQEYDAEKRIADLKGDGLKKEEVLEQYRQKVYDAQVERENALLALTEKQKEAVQDLAGGIANALLHGKSPAEFLRNTLLGYGTTAAKNLAGMGFEALTGGSGFHLPTAITGTAAAPNFFGQLLKGLPFAPGASGQGQPSSPIYGPSLAQLGISGGTADSGGAIAAAAGILPPNAAYANPGLIPSTEISPSGTPVAPDIYNLPSVNGPAYSNPALTPSLFGSGTDAISPFAIAAANPTAIRNDAAITSAAATSAKAMASVLKSNPALSKDLAAAGTIALGGYQAYSGFSRGGGQGIAQGIGGTLEAAGGIADLIPGGQVVGGALMAAGAVSSLVAAAFGDPRTNRKNQINKTLGQDQFYKPVSMNVDASVGGYATRYDMSGNLSQVAGLNPYPTTQAPYYNFQQNVMVPGRVTTTSGAAGPGTSPTTVNIQAMDAQSFAQYAAQNGDAVSAAVVASLQGSGGAGLVENLRPYLG